MRMLHIIDSGGLYGAEVMLLHLMEAQRELGLEPILASIGTLNGDEKPVETAARKRGLWVEAFRMLPGPNWAGAYRILRFAQQHRVRLLHSHGYKGNILFGLLPPRMRGLPMITTLHGWTWTGGLSRMMLYEKLDALSLRFVDQVVLVNGAMKSHPGLIGRRGNNFTVIENGLPASRQPAGDSDRKALRQDIIDFARGKATLCAAGRLSREKGFGILIAALGTLVDEGHDLRLVLFGEGTLRRELTLQISALGLGERVMMPGYIADAGGYLPFFDLLVLPSLTEGLPMVLLEAMNAGTPIVASHVGGIPAALDFGHAGILVAPHDVGSLKAGIRNAISNPAVAAKRSAVAYDRMKKFYSSETMARQYIDLYRQFAPEHLSLFG